MCCFYPSSCLFFFLRVVPSLFCVTTPRVVQFLGASQPPRDSIRGLWSRVDASLWAFPARPFSLLLSSWPDKEKGPERPPSSPPNQSGSGVRDEFPPAISPKCLSDPKSLGPARPLHLLLTGTSNQLGLPPFVFLPRGGRWVRAAGLSRASGALWTSSSLQ